MASRDQDRADDGAPRRAAASATRGADARRGHLRCPYCSAYEVDRLYLASVHMDSCECLSCGARWDEYCETGAFAGRGDSASVITPRKR